MPELSKEMFDFCVTHAARRNAELHTGEEVFADLGTAQWLSEYYASCKVLLQAMDKTLGDLFDDPEAAERMIVLLKDTQAKAVRRDIEAHKEEWQNKTAEDKETLSAQAAVWATRHERHRVECPACGNPSLIHGDRQGAVTRQVSEDIIVEKQTMLPSSFECVACNLRISGLSKLSACGLGDAFTATSVYSPAEFFGLHTHEELEEARAEFPDWEPDFEPDFND